MIIRLCIAFLLFAFAPAMAAEDLSSIAQQQAPLLEQVQLQLRQAETRAAEAERRERDAEIKRLEDEARAAGARASAAEQSTMAAQRETFIQQARTELQDQAYSRLEILIGVFGVLITLIVIFYALRTEKAAVAAATAGVEDIREKLEKRLAEAETLVQRIKDHKTQAEKIVDNLRAGESPKTDAERKTVADAAKAALAKPPRERSATDYRAILIDCFTQKKWVEMLDAAQQMRLLHEGNENYAFARFQEAYALEELKRFDEAIAAYEDVLTRFGSAPELELRKPVALAHYNKACAHARQGSGDEAVTALKAMIAAGRPLNPQEIAEERDFDPIREYPAFKKFLAENKG